MLLCAIVFAASASFAWAFEAAGSDPYVPVYVDAPVRIVRSVPLSSTEGSADDNSTNLKPRDDYDYCNGIREAVIGETQPFRIPLADAMACINKVRIDVDAATDTLTAISRTLAFHSQITWLKTSPWGKLDLLASLSLLASQVKSRPNLLQINFEKRISVYFQKARDRHLVWDGRLLSGLFQWERSLDLQLVSVSTDGGPPQIYTKSGVLAGNYDPVVKIDGVDAKSFIIKEGMTFGLHDQDAAWNVMFAATNMLGKGTQYVEPGCFAIPKYDPGTTTKLTFASGATLERENFALVQPAYFKKWLTIKSYKDMYNTFVRNPASKKPTATSKRSVENDSPIFYNDTDLPPLTENDEDYTAQKRGRSLARLELRKSRDDSSYGDREHVKQEPRARLERRALNEVFNPPFRTANNFDLQLASMFSKRTDGTEVLIYRCKSFPGVEGGLRSAILAIAETWNEAIRRNVRKAIIDAVQRFRASPEARLLWDVLGDKPMPKSKTTLTNIFSSVNYRDLNLQPFPDWASVFDGPDDINGDKVSSLWKKGFNFWNLKVSGMASLMQPEDVLLLTDGVVGSACYIVGEMLVQDAGVKSFAVGGRAESEKKGMAWVGDTKGTMAVSQNYIQQLASAYYSDLVSPIDGQTIPDIMPFVAPIWAETDKINFANLIRDVKTPGADSTYSTRDLADCHLWYTPEYLASDLVLYQEIGDIAWGVPGKFQSDKCLANPPGPVTAADDGADLPPGNGAVSSPDPAGGDTGTAGDGGAGDGGIGIPAK